MGSRGKTKKMKTSMDAAAVIVVLLLIILTFCALVSFLYRTWWSPNRTKQKMQSQGIHGPPYRFLHGNSKEVFRMNMEALRKPLDHLSHRILPRVQPHLLAWIQLYGRCVLAWVGPIPELIIAETELAKEILQNKDKTFLKLKMDGFMKRLLGNGVVTSEGERWVRKRKLIHQAFSPQSLKKMVPVMIDSVGVMLERWKRHDHNLEIEVCEEFRLLTSDVISRTAFGSNYEQGKIIFEMINKLSHLVAQSTYSLWLPPFLRKLIKRSKQEIEADKLEQSMEASILQMIKNREEEEDDVDDHAMDLLSLLLRAMKCEDNNIYGVINLKDIVDECKTFYFGGKHTTTSLLSWVVFLLAIHQEWQEKARNEVLMLLGNDPPNADKLSKMKTMSMIINETLRLYPVIDVIVRQIEKDVKLENKLVIPGNAKVTIQILAMHHDPETWGEDVYKFKPERFEEGAAQVKKKNEALGFMPFGFGPRICLGMNFALNETKIAISMILQRYAFRYLLATYMLQCGNWLLVPQHGIQVLLHPLF